MQKKTTAAFDDKHTTMEKYESKHQQILRSAEQIYTATAYVEQVKKQEARVERKEQRDEEIKKATDYYKNTTAKPGSLAAKANMVKMFNEKNNSGRDDNKKE